MGRFELRSHRPKLLECRRTRQSAHCGFDVGPVVFESVAHSYTRFISLLAAATTLSSCAPFVGSCTWVVPEAGPAIKVVEARKPIGGECECIGCDAPGRFLLERENYRLEFWNGDRWYTHLHVRARSKDGTILTLEADTPEFLRMAPHVPVADTHGFEYFMRIDPEDANKPEKPLNLRVLQPDGQVLGTENIRLRVETRSDWQVEYP